MPSSCLEGAGRSGASQPHKHLQFFPPKTRTRPDGPLIECLCLARAARVDKDGQYRHLDTFVS